ncbi:MAG: hypothetical protein H6835_19760 [Planctomycetes bacterium]|nr:hypothetical protein [Planctomycetota bacterium]
MVLLPFVLQAAPEVRRADLDEQRHACAATLYLFAEGTESSMTACHVCSGASQTCREGRLIATEVLTAASQTDSHDLPQHHPGAAVAAVRRAAAIVIT